MWTARLRSLQLLHCDDDGFDFADDGFDDGGGAAAAIVGYLQDTLQPQLAGLLSAAATHSGPKS